MLRLRQVQQRTGLSRSGIYQKISEGTFPKQISLGGRAVAWTSNSIDAWIYDRINQSSNGSTSAEVK